MSDKNFTITFDEAVKYIRQYVEKFELRNKSGSATSLIGGTIETELLKSQLDYLNKLEDYTQEAGASDDVKKPYQGLMCWYCWGASRSDLPEHFFLSFEINGHVIISGPDRTTEPDQPVLARPFDFLIFDREHDHDDISDWLKSRVPINHRYEDRINRGNSGDEGCRKLIKEFISNIKPIEPSNSEYPFGLFESKVSNDVMDFLNTENMKYIRYYFGYDPENEVNKIRIILFGVDSEGRNLLPRGMALEMMGGGNGDDDPTIIEKSWPPPTG